MKTKTTMSFLSFNQRSALWKLSGAGFGGVADAAAAAADIVPADSAAAVADTVVAGARVGAGEVGGSQSSVFGEWAHHPDHRQTQTQLQPGLLHNSLLGQWIG